MRASQLQLVPSSLERSLPPEARTRRDKLEQAIQQLREAKPEMSEDEYYQRLESLMVELARVYQR